MWARYVCVCGHVYGCVWERKIERKSPTSFESTAFYLRTINYVCRQKSLESTRFVTERRFSTKKSTHDFFRLPPKKNLKHFFPDPGAAILFLFLFLFLLQFPKTASGPPEFVLRLVLLKRLWGRSPETKFNLKCFRVMRGCKWSCFWEGSCLGLEDYSEAFFKITSSW